MTILSDHVSAELCGLALHEAAHAVTAAALGCKVGYVYIRLMHGALVGRTHYHLRQDMKPSQRAAILLAGICGQTWYQHLKLAAPPLHLLKQLPEPHKQPSRLKQAIAHYHINKPSLDNSLLPDGDLRQVQSILSRCKSPELALRKAEKIARQILDDNELPLRRTAQNLLSVGKLTGTHLAGLLAGITTYDMGVKR